MKKIALTFSVFLFLSTAFLCAEEGVAESVQKFVDAGTLPGIVSVTADKDGKLTIESAGWANIEKQIPMSEDSIFWIASQSKGITAAALLMLVDEGKVDLDAPVEAYLPEFKNIRVEEAGENGINTLRPPKTKPTLRQMMCHTGGLRFITPQMTEFGIDVFPMRQLASTLVQVNLFTDPGMQFSYSNLGIDVCAAVIEVVSGMTFEDFLQKRLFDPLTMTETSFWLTEDQLQRLAQSYSIIDGKPVATQISQLAYPLTDRIHRHAEGGGGLFSTPRDIIKFYQMLAARGIFNGRRILSEKAIEILSTKQTPEGVSEPYSQGMWTDGIWIWHGGAYGTEGRANIKTGEARVYMVQLSSSPDPKIKETVDAVLNSRVQ